VFLVYEQFRKSHKSKLRVLSAELVRGWQRTCL
jgi:hypothetical protein